MNPTDPRISLGSNKLQCEAGLPGAIFRRHNIASPDGHRG